MFWFIARRPSLHHNSTLSSSSTSSYSFGNQRLRASKAFWIISFWPFCISSKKESTSEVKISTLLGPELSFTSTGVAPLAPFPPAGAFGWASPSLLTYFVILALIESKVFLKELVNYFCNKVSQILTASFAWF